MSKTAKIVIGALVILLVIVFAITRNDGSAPATGTDTSDQSLNQDTAAIDADLNGLDADRRTIDQGLNDDGSVE